MENNCNRIQIQKMIPPIKKANFLKILEKRKTQREKIEGIQEHFLGYCVHVGKISYGCMGCFRDVKYSFSEALGWKCNLNCSYCFSNKNLVEKTEKQIDDMIGSHYRNSLNPDYGKVGPRGFAFTMGEPLLYMKRLEKYMYHLKEIEKRTGNRPYYKLYTNGVLATKDILKKIKKIGIDELRFHPSASNFSTEVYKNMEEAVKMGFIVAVEEPCWPKNRKKLFEMLPIIEKIGVRHLQMCIVEVYDYNIASIYKDYPEGIFFHDQLLHMYDEGLVYDIMEEVIDKKYKFSVLDCSNEVHRLNRCQSKRVAEACEKDEEKKVFFNPWEEGILKG
jgi:pyruvate formate-lyase activating enzyme-like uncharacterized protein